MKINGKWQPTIKQANFCDALLSGLDITHAAEAAGMTRDSYYKSLRGNPNWHAYLEKRRAEEAEAKMPGVDKKLFEKAYAGDMTAIRICYEIFGNLRTGNQVTINNQIQAPDGDKPSETIKTKLDELAARRKAAVSE